VARADLGVQTPALLVERSLLEADLQPPQVEQDAAP
jgi:hypothetical protein